MPVDLTVISLHDDPDSTFYYDGFHGIPSKCRLVRWVSGAEIYIAFSHFKWGGTSPTNMVEELATLTRTVYYPETNPSDLNFFDHWPAEHSLTHQEELIPVWLDWDAQSRRYEYPEWRRDLQAPSAFRLLVRNVVSVARAFAREHGANEEECV